MASDRTPPKAVRIEHIADMMRTLKFKRGKTVKELCVKWDISPAELRRDSSEASRIVTREFTDVEGVKRDLGVALSDAVHRTHEEGDVKNLVAAAQVYATVTGARAADKHEVKAVTGSMTPQEARDIMAKRFGHTTPDAKDDE